MPVLFLLTLLTAAPEQYACKRTAPAPVIDGRLDDPAWRKAAWSGYFVDIQGAAKPGPRFHTRMKMLWDERYLYIAAEMEEPHLWATYRQHDAVIFHENDFEVFLDPDGDTLDYFEFEINVLNTGWDLHLNKPYRMKGKADNGWEMPGLLTAVHAEGTVNDARDVDRGWSVEMALPWSAFNRGKRPARTPVADETWRMNFSRVEWRTDVVKGSYVKRPGLKEDNWVWSPQGEINMHIPERWGVVRFVN